MALAAGLGTRMRPITNDRPKALVEVGGRTLLDWALDRYAVAGVEQAVVNIHHFADLMEAHLASRTEEPQVSISDERDLVLETGGGVVKALPMLGVKVAREEADALFDSLDSDGSGEIDYSELVTCAP